MRVRESAIERALVFAVRGMGGVAIKLMSPSSCGLPDRMILLPEGQARFVECKAIDGRLSAIQALTHEQLRFLGFAVDVVNSLEAVDEWASSL